MDVVVDLILGRRLQSCRTIVQHLAFFFDVNLFSRSLE